MTHKKDSQKLKNSNSFNPFIPILVTKIGKRTES